MSKTEIPSKLVDSRRIKALIIFAVFCIVLFFSIFCLPIFKNLVDTQPEKLALVLCKASSKFDDSKDYEKEDFLISLALKIHSDVKGNSSGALLSNCYANYFDRKGQVEKAEFYYKKSLEINKKLVGYSSNSTVNAMNSLVDFYISSKDWTKAEEVASTMIEDSKQFPLMQWESKSTLAHIYIPQKSKRLIAEKLIRNVLSEKVKNYGWWHASSLESQKQLANCLTLMKKHEGAELYKELYFYYKDTYGESDERTIGSMWLLFSSYSQLQEFSKAESLAREVVRISKRNHLDKVTIQYLMFLGELLLYQHRYKAAQHSYSEGLELATKVYGARSKMASSFRKGLLICKSKVKK